MCIRDSQQTGDLTLQSGQLLMEVQYQSYADNLNELSTAYQTLSSGQSLNLNQLEEMRSKYPQIDDYLQKTNDLTLRNGEVLREAADAQKEATCLLYTSVLPVRWLVSYRLPQM